MLKFVVNRFNNLNFTVMKNNYVLTLLLAFAFGITANGLSAQGLYASLNLDTDLGKAR
jgi:hypothetical protein